MGEPQRIARLTARLDARELIVPPGDDAAVVAAGGPVVVTSVDAVVDGVHFTLSEWPIAAVGRKAVGAALSDLAAMGVSAGEIYVAAGLPRSIDEPLFDQLIDGIATAAEAGGAVVAGGDLTGAGELWISVTVVGYADSPEAVVKRSGARTGEIVVVTGELGGARRALELIGHGIDPADPRLARQFMPVPRLAAGALLAEHGTSAMIDISDGLAGDAAQLARASGVRIELELERLPLVGGVDDPAFAAASGEEYELLATIAEDRFAAAERALAASGLSLTQIGRVTDGAGVQLGGAGGEIRGFEHFD